MVVRYSWLRKDFDDLQKKLSQEGFTVQPKIEGRVDQNGKIITETTQLTAYSDNYTWVAGPRKGELLPREVKENVKTTSRDEKFFRLYCNEFYRHTMSGEAAIMGGTIGGGMVIFGMMYLLSQYLPQLLGH